MNRYLLALTALFMGCAAVSAQKSQGPKLWEESSARKLDPEVRVFIRPQVCDMTMLTQNRETYGPYTFEMKSFDALTNADLASFQARALFRATKEADADAVIEPMFNSYVYEKDNKVMVIELSGYPVRYSNFHPITNDEIEMVEKIYTQSINEDHAAVIRRAAETQQSR